jgi:hypothetical protein
LVVAIEIASIVDEDAGTYCIDEIGTHQWYQLEVDNRLLPLAQA